MRYLFTVLLFISSSASAQVWTVWNHSQKLNDKWGLFFDFQLREFNAPNRLARTVVVRPAIQYRLSKVLQVSAGYGFFDGVADFDEGRIWEQLRIDQKGKAFTLFHQFRLEQRFLEKNGDEAYLSHRLRYLVRSDIPFSGDSVFIKGFYAGLQNELFLNLANSPNGQVLDQNRLFLAVGHRFSSKTDLEAGYLFRRLWSAVINNRTENILQFRLLTRF